MLTKLYDSLVNSNKTIIQITSKLVLDKTSLLLHYANFYVSIGKFVILVDYSNVDFYYIIDTIVDLEKLKNVNKFKIVKNVDLVTLTDTYKNILSDKFVILIDELDNIPTLEFNGAPSKEKLYFIKTLNELLKYVNHIVFTNRCYSYSNIKNIHSVDDLVETSIKIPVSYSIHLGYGYKFSDEIKGLFKVAQRVYKISKINFDEL